MIVGINITCDISKLSHFTRLMAREITHNNFEISLVVLMPNITTNRAITYMSGFMKTGLQRLSKGPTLSVSLVSRL